MVAARFVQLGLFSAMLFGWLFLSFAQAATVFTAQVDKNPVMLGEELILQVDINTKISASALDLSGLQADFSYSAPSVSQSMQIINGQSSQNTRWQVRLRPKTTGTLQIPAFEVASLKTDPITLTVLPASETGHGSEELFIETRLTAENLHIQQMAYYEVKIFYAGDLQRGSLSQPELANVTIEQIGKDIEGTELVNGKRYQTITRRFSVVPQQSGQFELTAPWFEGEMLERQQNPYDHFARTKTVSAQGQVVRLNVQPIPPNFQGQWVVSELLTLQEEWSADPSHIVQGEPITRTMTLTAMDLADHQLPDFVMPLPAGFKRYDEKPQGKKAERKGRMVAQKVFSSALIATDVGEFTLPAVRIPWWNTVKGEIDYAELPARTIYVKANPMQVPTDVPADARANTPPAVSYQTTEPQPWQWNSLALTLLALWLLTLVAWFIQQRGLPFARKPAPAVPLTNSTIKFNPRRFKSACVAADQSLVRDYLLRWGQQHFQQPMHQLSELIRLLPAGELKLQLELLAYADYRLDAVSWQGDALYQAWLEFVDSEAQSAASASASLSSLYPK